MLMCFDAIVSPCRITYKLGYIVLCTHMIMIWNPSIKTVRGRYPNRGVGDSV